MLRAEKVRPMDSPMIRGQLKPLPLKKTVRIALNRGAIFALTTNRPPALEVLQYFELTDWDLRDPDLRFTIKDRSGHWYDGVSGRPVQLDDKLIIDIIPPFQLVNSDYGLRPVFTLHMPFGYRVHHLSYLRRKFPHLT
jgi:hypothetical protein